MSFHSIKPTSQGLQADLLKQVYDHLGVVPLVCPHHEGSSISTHHHTCTCTRQCICTHTCTTHMHMHLHTHMHHTCTWAQITACACVHHCTLHRHRSPHEGMHRLTHIHTHHVVQVPLEKTAKKHAHPRQQDSPASANKWKITVRLRQRAKNKWAMVQT